MTKQFFLTNMAFFYLFGSCALLAYSITMSLWGPMVGFIFLTVISVINFAWQYRECLKKEEAIMDRLSAAENEIMDLHKVTALAHMRLDDALSEVEADGDEPIGMN